MNDQPKSPPQGVSRLFRSPDGRLRSGWRLAGQLLFLLVLLIPALTVAGLLLVLLPGVSLEALTGEALGETVLLVSAPAQFVAMVGSVFLARRLLDRRSILSLGLSWRRTAGRDLLAGVLLTLPMIGSIFLVEWAAGWLQIESFAWQSRPLSAWLPSLLALLVVFILVGFGEEITFRGYWLQNLEEGVKLPWAVAISSLAFSLAHLQNPGISVPAVLGLVAAGLLFAFAYLRSGSLWLPIGVHIGWNFFEGPVFGFPVSGLEAVRLIEQTAQGPSLWTGGEFGPEAGLLLLPALALGAALIALYTRARPRHGI